MMTGTNQSSRPSCLLGSTHGDVDRLLDFLIVMANGIDCGNV
jgi:hypothetical protein